ncbi:MAG TPA: hypothetical protein VJ830_08715 [Anaerolineales bacterium]|nr:hypothetical protein [Anaerolineales bacterium]
MNPKIIVIDGKTYNGIEDMPPDVRQKYEQAMRSFGDANSIGIPDAWETLNIFADTDQDGMPDGLKTITAGHQLGHSMKVIVDGKEFNGLEHLPPEARAKYEEAMGKLDANRNGIPDFVEGMMNTTTQNVMSASSPVVERQQYSPPLSSPTITPDTSNGWMLMLAGLFIVLLCVAVAGGAWYFFLR